VLLPTRWPAPEFSDAFHFVRVRFWRPPPLKYWPQFPVLQLYAVLDLAPMQGDSRLLVLEGELDSESVEYGFIRIL